MIRYRTVLNHNAGLGTLLSAQAPADFADWLDFVAIGALLAFVWQAPPIAFAWLAIAMGLPYLTIGIAAGALVDRVNLRAILIGSNLGRAVATAALIVVPDWPWLMVVVFLRSAVDSLFTPAKQSAIQALTRPEDLLLANGASHAINQSAKIVAPALGGAALVITVPQTVFAVNCVVSLIAMLLLTRLPSLPRPATRDRDGRIGQDIAAGLTLVRRTPVLGATIGLMAAGYFAMFFYDSLFAPLIEALGHTPQTLGLVLAAIGAGGVVGALGLGGWTATARAARCFVLIAAGSAAAAACIGFLGLAEALDLDLVLAPLLILATCIGLASAISVVPTRALLQTHTPQGAMGRISALSEAANTVALLIGPFIGAALASVTTIGAAFMLGAALLGLVAAAGLHLAWKSG